MSFESHPGFNQPPSFEPESWQIGQYLLDVNFSYEKGLGGVALPIEAFLYGMRVARGGFALSPREAELPDFFAVEELFAGKTTPHHAIVSDANSVNGFSPEFDLQLTERIIDWGIQNLPSAKIPLLYGYARETEPLQAILESKGFVFRGFLLNFSWNPVPKKRYEKEI